MSGQTLTCGGSESTLGGVQKSGRDRLRCVISMLSLVLNVDEIAWRLRYWIDYNHHGGKLRGAGRDALYGRREGFGM